MQSVNSSANINFVGYWGQWAPSWFVSNDFILQIDYTTCMQQVLTIFEEWSVFRVFQWIIITLQAASLRLWDINLNVTQLGSVCHSHSCVRPHQIKRMGKTNLTFYWFSAWTLIYHILHNDHAQLLLDIVSRDEKVSFVFTTVYLR